MNYTLADISGLVLAVGACGVLLALPGLALTRLLDRSGLLRIEGTDALMLAPALATAVLPVLDNLAFMLIGRDAALLINLVLGAFGLRALAELGWPRPSRFALLAGLAWLAVLAISWVDLDWNGGLYASLLAVDAVKHASIVRVLTDSGVAPPPDPFFLRTEPASYYYFYYIVSALAERLGGGLIDARMAVAGQTFWTGVALAGLLRHLLGVAAIAPAKGREALLVALMAMSGLQAVVVVSSGLSTGFWPQQVDWWGDQVTSLPFSLVWVPHHVAGVVAIWTGLLMAARAIAAFEDSEPHTILAGAVGLSALAFASSAGLSIWVALTGGLIVALWMGVLAFERRFAAVAIIAAAGAVAVLSDLPFLHSLLGQRASGGIPLTIAVRPFQIIDKALEPGLLQTLARIVLLPLNYLMCLGVLAVGAAAYWVARPTSPERAAEREVARLVVLSAIAGLLIGSFVRSTIANNDLGWRAMLFAQLAAVLWTLAAWERVAGRVPELGLRALAAASPLVTLMIAIGYGSLAYNLVALRTLATFNLNGAVYVPPAHAFDREVRSANSWLARHAGPSLIVQHNPGFPRAFGSGLYGRSPVAVSDDHNGGLLGAPPAEVERRIVELWNVFQGKMPEAEALTRLASYRVGALVVTSADPIWRDKSAWIWSRPALMSSDHVRVVDLRATAR